MDGVDIFLCGAAGSLAVEVCRICGILERRGYLPARYRKATFWFARLLLAAAGGGLSVAYDVETPILAVNIGAAAPVIISVFSSTPPPAEAGGHAE